MRACPALARACGQVYEGGRRGARRAARSQWRRLDYAAERLWELSLALQPLPTRGEVTALLRRNGLGTFSDYVDNQLHGAGPRNFLPCDRESWVGELQDGWPAAAKETVAASEALLEGKVSFFGREGLAAARGRSRSGLALFDWQRDPLSRARFPRTVSNWRWGPGVVGGADIKGPWELTRAQHLVTLGQAYSITQDERYAEHYALTITDFTRRNPVRLGAHWACTMDVALRVVGWLAALPFFQGSPALDRRWWESFCRSLVAHGRFISAHLEFGTLDGRVVTSNHYLADIFGLHWLALNFPGLDAAAGWRATAERALEAECQAQVGPDGGPYESSIPYLRLVLEMLLSAWALSVHAGRPLSPAFRARLVAGLEFLAAVREESGRLPQVGDADNGRAHIFTYYGSWATESADWLLVAGAHVLGRRDLAEGVDARYRAEALFWGRPGEEEASSGPGPLGPKRSEGPAARLFASSGVGVLKDGPSHLTLINTPLGTGGFGNHKHNDQLSVEWCVGPQPVLVDPGSYSYTRDPQARNAFRGTAFHTTLRVDGREQNELRPELLFRLFAHGTGQLWSTSGGLGGEHSAYERLGVSFRRRVSAIGGGRMVVDDFFSGSEGHLLEWAFTLHPGVVVRLEGRRAVLTGPLGHGSLVTEDLPLAVRKGWYSPGYGQKSPTTQLFSTRDDGPGRVTWALLPYDADVAIKDARHEADALWGKGG